MDITLALDWYPRWATIILVNSSASSTFDLQSEIDHLFKRIIETSSLRFIGSNRLKGTLNEVSRFHVLNTLNFKRRARLDLSLNAIEPQKDNGPIRFDVNSCL